MNNQDHKIALLIDYDNFNQEKYLTILLDELSEMGDVLIKYAFYSNFEDKTIEAKFTKYGVQPMSQIAYSKGKNAVDIRMTIEAMRLLNKSFIDTICLASSDSDFIPLALELKSNNINVIGAGDNKAKEEYKKAFDEFISVEKISAAPEQNTKNTSLSKELLELIKTINKIIETNADEKGLADFSLVIQSLRNEMKDFNPKNYGAQNKNVLPFFKSTLTNQYFITKQGTTLFIQKNQSN